MKGMRLAYLLAGLAALWLAACSPDSGQTPPAVEEGRSPLAGAADLAASGQSGTADRVLVDMETSAGRITLELYPEKAPVTVGNFLRYVNLGHYDGSAFYRVVRLDNQKPSDIPIQVIQGGLLGDMMSGRADAAELDMSSMLPPILHETTEQTGIRHVDGTISMARFTPGSASSEFFITIGDNAPLDFGGMRNPDGQGFAAFGRVIEGMDAVRSIQALPSATPLPENMAVVAGQILEEPLPIISARLRTSSDAAAAAAITAEVQAWALEHDLMLRQRRGLAVTSLPDTSLEAIRADADYAAGMLQRIDALDLAGLNEANHRAVVSLQAIQHTFRGMAAAPERYWHEFTITPYAGLFTFYVVNNVLPGLPLQQAPQRSAYLDMVDDLAAIIEQQGIRTEGQAERGILLPKPAIAGVRATLAGQKAAVQALLVPARERFEGVEESDIKAFEAELKARIGERILPAYDAILGLIDADYEGRAPEAVGLSIYPGGEAIYRELVRQQVSYDVTPEELHASGLEILDALRAEMQKIRDEVGFRGTQAEFHAALRKMPRFIAENPAEVEARYMGYIARIEPLVGDYFKLLPAAPYGVKRLDPAAESGQTFGYYQMPSPAEPRGLYRYNGSLLAERPLVWAQGLIYHELIPGHHFQIALQQEMDDLPLMLQSFYFLVNAYTEGWAEYASSLGEEMGLYDDPYDRYGRLLMESFVATRLVVDTGLNLYGWPLERARQFMRENTFASETEIATETLRYSTDIPGQALGYRFGSDFIWKLRRDKEAELGDAFDLKDFHDAVLGYGMLPLWVLEEHVDWYFANRD